jgi:hypothetical protein
MGSMHTYDADIDKAVSQNQTRSKHMAHVRVHIHLEAYSYYPNTPACLHACMPSFQNKGKAWIIYIYIYIYIYVYIHMSCMYVWKPGLRYTSDMLVPHNHHNHDYTFADDMLMAQHNHIYTIGILQMCIPNTCLRMLTCGMQYNKSMIM